MTANLNTVTLKLNSTDNVIGTLLNDQAFNKTLKSTLVNLDSSTLNLNRGLEALEYTWPFRRGFKRLNKAEEN
jgi:phospholipid/cholesterol/gamma-HCH transport system substrate-binding protein